MSERVATRWGCNLFTSADAAEIGAQGTLRAGADYYIWKTVDGFYDWSAIPDVNTPWLETAKLVTSRVAAEHKGTDS